MQFQMDTKLKRIIATIWKLYFAASKQILLISYSDIYIIGNVMKTEEARHKGLFFTAKSCNFT